MCTCVQVKRCVHVCARVCTCVQVKRCVVYRCVMKDGVKYRFCVRHYVLVRHYALVSNVSRVLIEGAVDCISKLVNLYGAQACNCCVCV